MWSPLPSTASSPMALFPLLGQGRPLAVLGTCIFWPGSPLSFCLHQMSGKRSRAWRAGRRREALKPALCLPLWGGRKD